MSKVFFAIACNSTVVNGITILEFDNPKPLDAKAVDSMAAHIRLVLDHLEKPMVDAIVDEMIEKNERMLLSKMMVSIADPDFRDRNYGTKVAEQVYAEYDKRFPKEVGT
jgi:hypothetical protein